MVARYSLLLMIHVFVFNILPRGVLLLPMTHIEKSDCAHELMYSCSSVHIQRKNHPHLQPVALLKSFILVQQECLPARVHVQRNKHAPYFFQKSRGSGWRTKEVL